MTGDKEIDDNTLWYDEVINKCMEEGSDDEPPEEVSQDPASR